MTPEEILRKRIVGVVTDEDIEDSNSNFSFYLEEVKDSMNEWANVQVDEFKSSLREEIEKEIKNNNIALEYGRGKERGLKLALEIINKLKP